jgi:hypothetical protein
VVEFYGYVVEAFQNQHWAMKNFMDVGKGGY